MTRSPLAVVVPTRDRPEQLARCLAALRLQLTELDELVVSDSASRDAAQIAAVAAEAGVSLVRCGEKGASRARNAGWMATTAAEVVFVDDDVLVLPGWADALRGVALQDGVAFASGRTVAPEGAREAASVTGAPPDEVITQRSGVGSFGATNPLAVRRSVLEAVGGFDERIGPGTPLKAGEDLELLDRVLEAGWTGRYVHDAVAVHEQWRSRAERRRLEFAYGQGMGARVAAALRRDLRTGVALLPDALRLEGLLTMLRRAKPTAAPAQSDDRPDSGGWLLPALWRIGALVGLVSGLVRLPPRTRSAAPRG